MPKGDSLEKRKHVCLMLPGDPLSIYKKQGNLGQFLDKPIYYADKLGPVFILNIDKEEIFSQNEGVEIINLRPSFLPRPFHQQFINLFKYAKKTKASFIRAPDGGTFVRSAIAGLVSKLCGVPSVISIHGYYEDLWNIEYRGFLLKPIFSFAKWLTGLTADLLFAVSSHTKSETYPRAFVVPNYVNTNLFTPSTNPKKYDLLYVGSLREVKSIPLLVEAFAKVRKKIPNATLFVAGYGPFEKALNQPGIVYQGAVAHKELPCVYAASKIFVTATLSESFCMPVIEAQASGVPVVAFDLPVFHENTIPGETSLLARYKDTDDLADKIIRLLLDREKREAMSREARKFSLKFDKRKVLDYEISLIRQMLKEKSK